MRVSLSLDLRTDVVRFGLRALRRALTDGRCRRILRRWQTLRPDNRPGARKRRIGLRRAGRRGRTFDKGAALIGSGQRRRMAFLDLLNLSERRSF